MLAGKYEEHNSVLLKALEKCRNDIKRKENDYNSMVQQNEESMYNWLLNVVIMFLRFKHYANYI